MRKIKVYHKWVCIYCYKIAHLNNHDMKYKNQDSNNAKIDKIIIIKKGARPHKIYNTAYFIFL